MAQRVITDTEKKRVAELIGMGLSYAEAAGAHKMGTTSVERILKDPVYRAIMDDTKRQRTSIAGQAAGVVRSLLEAVDDKGQPALGTRKLGAELYAKNPALIDAAFDDTGDDLLPGVVLRFPHPAG